MTFNKLLRPPNTVYSSLAGLKNAKLLLFH